MLIYKGPTPSNKIIRILKDGAHYDWCNSFKVFLDKSYFCDECNRGYNTEDHKKSSMWWKMVSFLQTSWVSRFQRGQTPDGSWQVSFTYFYLHTMSLHVLWWWLSHISSFSPQSKSCFNLPHLQSVSNVVRPTRSKVLGNPDADLKNTSVVGANILSVENRFTSLLTNATFSPYQKMKMIPNWNEFLEMKLGHLPSSNQILTIRTLQST